MPTRLPLPGAHVRIRQRRWTVERALLDRRVLRLDVVSGHEHLTFLSPFDRTTFDRRRARPRRCRRQHGHARLARVLAARHAFDMPTTTVRARMDLLDYQLEPVLAVLAGVRRVLLADEVGLGKTIQAGLVLAELRQRRATFLALVIVPAALIDQWMDELGDRFSLEPRVLSQGSLDAEAEHLPVGASPAHRAGLWVASADFVKQPHVLDAIPLVAWDAVVVDEAHIMTGDSDRHAACHRLARRARHVVLLTATPHSGDDERFRRLLNIGRLGDQSASAADDIRVFRRTRTDATRRSAPAVRWHHVRPGNDVARLLDLLGGFERSVRLAADARRLPSADLLLSVFRKRASSSMHALDQTLARRIEWLSTSDGEYRLEWLQTPLPFLEGELHDAEERAALVGETGLPSHQERSWLRRLRALCSGALPHDPKIRRVTRLVGRLGEPVVIFTEYRSSLDALYARLRQMRKVAVLHGGLSSNERRQELQQFLRGDASVLLATDVGGQGLNLQSRSRWVVNLDVPWNPTRLAQRIGRVDRIGQTRPVHVTLVVLDHVVEDRIVAAMERRVERAEWALGDEPRTGSRVVSPNSALAPVSLAFRSCTEWQLRARAVAKVLADRRAWMTLWRADPIESSRPRLVRGIGALGWSRKLACVNASRSILFVSVPLTADGEIVERAVHVFTSTIDVSQGCLARVEATVASMLEPLMHSRAARVRRALKASALRRLGIERAVGSALAADASPKSTQLMLFSQAQNTLITAARHATALARAEADDRIRTLETPIVVALGSPTIEVLFARETAL